MNRRFVPKQHIFEQSTLEIAAPCAMTSKRSFAFLVEPISQYSPQMIDRHALCQILGNDRMRTPTRGALFLHTPPYHTPHTLSGPLCSMCSTNHPIKPFLGSTQSLLLQQYVQQAKNIPILSRESNLVGTIHLYFLIILCSQRNR